MDADLYLLPLYRTRHTQPRTTTLTLTLYLTRLGGQGRPSGIRHNHASTSRGAHVAGAASLILPVACPTCVTPPEACGAGEGGAGGPKRDSAGGGAGAALVERSAATVEGRRRRVYVGALGLAATAACVQKADTGEEVRSFLQRQILATEGWSTFPTSRLYCSFQRSTVPPLSGRFLACEGQRGGAIMYS